MHFKQDDIKKMKFQLNAMKSLLGPAEASSLEIFKAKQDKALVSMLSCSKQSCTARSTHYFIFSNSFIF